MPVQLLFEAEIQTTREGVVEGSRGHTIHVRILVPRDQCGDRPDKVSKAWAGFAINMKMNLILLEDETNFR